MRAIGIDLGGTSAKIGALEDGKILERAAVQTRQDSDYGGILRDLAAAAGTLAEKYGAERVGIGSPGLIDRAGRRVCYSNNIRWNDAPLGLDLERELGLPVRMANDAKCAALGEALCGAGRGYSRVLMLTLGTGVGGGFVENGKLAAGSLYADAAEIFGHITVEYVGRQCTCGRRGCLEAYCSATALMRRGREVFGREVSAKEIFALAGSGNAAAAELTEEFAEYLAAGAVSLANALRPQAIVFGGGVSGSAGDFLPIIDRHLKEEVYGYAFAPVKAVAAQLGNDAGMIGAALLQ